MAHIWRISQLVPPALVLLLSLLAKGASAATAPGTIKPLKASMSTVFSSELRSVAGTDRRPLLTILRANGC